jgi:hypothetical protein
MKKYYKGKWVKALESGKYRQTDSILHEKGKHGGHPKFCCLGVICVVAKIKQEEESEDCYFYDGDATSLTENLLGKFGLTHNEQSTLMKMNDNGDSFKEIAQWIRKNL